MDETGRTDDTDRSNDTDRMDDTHRARLAIQRCRTRGAPDSRVAVFDVTPESTVDGITLLGSVSTPRLERDVCDAVEGTTGRATTSELTVLEGIRSEATVSLPVTPVRDETDTEAEQVTQMLYGARVAVFDHDGAWSRVLTPDGYLGWIDGNALTEITVEDVNAVVAHDTTTIGGDKVYAGTSCRIEDDETEVVFRTGERSAPPTDAVHRLPTNPTGEDVVEIARWFLGTEYCWGGMTNDGIDCSGLTWISYRVNGIVLPRDAD